MSERILVGTRKGTFFATKIGSRWRPKLAGHLGVGVNFVARDPKRGTLWAALGHGHWGAKLSRSTDDGATWTDAEQIKYPEGARHYLPPPPTETGPGEGKPTLKPATLLKLWTIAFGQDGGMYVGTIPGGLFVSSDGGETFELNRGLWDHESRGGDLFRGEGNGTTRWYGTPAAEGEFAPGIHSIVVDPRNPRRILVAISTAGVFETTDAGRTWRTRNKGLSMDYSPDPTDEWAGHDPHAILASDAPERLAALADVARLERRPHRLQLHDLGVGELAREQRGAILTEQQDGRGERHDDHAKQEQREPSEQRAREERHGSRPGAPASAGTYM